MVIQTVGCRLCGGDLDEPELEIGSLPPCNHFTSQADTGVRHSLAMTACRHCGLVQLTKHPSFRDVVPRVPWISYSEPEAHLDAVLGRLDPSIKTVFGLSPFDEPLLARLAQRVSDVRALNPVESSHGPGLYPYLETLQDNLRPSPLAAVATVAGRADLVVLRYILEHSHDPRATLEGLKQLIAPGGSLLIEVPDSSKFLARCDYSFIWEEHICYFTAPTLAALALRAGYGVDDLVRYEGPLEDALVARLRPIEGSRFTAPPIKADAVFEAYRDNFPRIRAAYRAKMAEHQAGGSEMAICGIGHQAIMFLNALELQPYIAMMVDDDPSKLGQFAPGATMPIVSSATMLATSSIDACFLAVNPRNEEKVKDKLGGLTDRGGRFYSIFSGGASPTLVEVT